MRDQLVTYAAPFTPPLGLTYDGNLGGDFETMAQTRLLISDFAGRTSVEMVASLPLYVDTTFPDLLSLIFRDLDHPTITFLSQAVIVAWDKEQMLQIETGNYSAPFRKEGRGCTITFRGTLSAVQRTYERLEKYRHEERVSNVEWWFMSGDNMRSETFRLNVSTQFNAAYCPWIADVPAYIEAFNKSHANVLILLGDPGTGKTSFIRHLLGSTHESCATTYDEKVMGQDGMYINFLSSFGTKYLVLEDADLLLSRRMHDGNHVMSKILNASDGLVSFADKKMIFTANITDMNKIDEALLRPGRCYDVLHFRPLTHAEAEVAADVAGRPLAQSGNVTVAELFNSRPKAA